MKIKNLLVSGAMLLSLVAIGSAKSWEVVVDSNTKAGTVVLPAGTYTVKLDNNQATFTAENGKKFTVPVKVDNGATKKYDATEVKTAKDGDTTIIKSIDLSGTTEELQFGE